MWSLGLGVHSCARTGPAGLGKRCGESGCLTSRLEMASLTELPGVSSRSPRSAGLEFHPPCQPGFRDRTGGPKGPCGGPYGVVFDSLGAL